MKNNFGYSFGAAAFITAAFLLNTGTAAYADVAQAQTADAQTQTSLTHNLQQISSPSNPASPLTLQADAAAVPVTLDGSKLLTNVPLDEFEESDTRTASIHYLMNYALTKASPTQLYEAQALTTAPMPEFIQSLPSDPAVPLPTQPTEGEIDVTKLFEGKCTEAGDTFNGSLSCLQEYADNSVRDVSIHYLTEGNVYKRQTISTEFDAKGHRLSKRSVRYRADYVFREGKRIKTVERFDIVLRPLTGKITRELIVVQYHAQTEKTKKVTWAKYRQIGEEMSAEISHHAYLTYDEAGLPLKGRVEKWQDRQVVDTLLNWNLATNQTFRVEQSDWQTWEGWLQRIILSAIYP